MEDRFEHYIPSIISPADRATPIVPSDSDGLPVRPKGVYVGTGGDVVMRGALEPADILFKNVPSGAILPFRPVMVKATGTTAAHLLALD